MGFAQSRFALRVERSCAVLSAHSRNIPHKGAAVPELDEALRRLLELARSKGLRPATDGERRHADPRHLFQAVTVSGKYHGPLFVEIGEYGDENGNFLV